MSIPPIIGTIEINWRGQDGELALHEVPVVAVGSFNGETFAIVRDRDEPDGKGPGWFIAYPVRIGIRAGFWEPSPARAMESAFIRWIGRRLIPLDELADKHYPDRLPVRGTVREAWA